MSLDGAYEDDNIFAKIIRGEIPSTRIFEDDDVLALMDVFPQSKGHALVISKTSKARNLLDVEPEVLSKLAAATQRLARAAVTALSPDGVVVTQFNGAPAGQTIFHLHFHVIPRYEGAALGRHAGGGHGRSRGAQGVGREDRRGPVMAKLRIYGDSISGNCLKVKWTAERLGRPFDWIEIDITKGESRTPDYLAINPWGQVPTVVLEDGRPLAQSNAIILHLAEGSDLIPADAYDRARMFEWLFWEQYSHEPTIAVARFRVRYQGQPVADLDPNLVAKGKAALQRMEDHLAGRAFLVGDALSLADIALVAYTRMADEGGFDLAAYPALQAWIARVDQELSL